MASVSRLELADASASNRGRSSRASEPEAKGGKEYTKILTR